MQCFLYTKQLKISRIETVLDKELTAVVRNCGWRYMVHVVNSLLMLSRFRYWQLRRCHHSHIAGAMWLGCAAIEAILNAIKEYRFGRKHTKSVSGRSVGVAAACRLLSLHYICDCLWPSSVHAVPSRRLLQSSRLPLPSSLFIALHYCRKPVVYNGGWQVPG